MSSFSTSFFALDPGNAKPPAMDNSGDHVGDSPDHANNEQGGSWQRLPSSDNGDPSHPDNGTAVIDHHDGAPADEDEDIAGPYHPVHHGDEMINSDPPQASSPPGRDGDEDTPIPDAPATEDTKSTTTFSSPQSKPSGPKKKKKGTASVVKAPKRTPASASAPGGASRRGKKTSQPGGAQRKSPDGVLTRPSGGGDGSEESDSGPYCICRGPDNHRFMISCDRCEDWFHGECIGMDKFTGENLIQSYICPGCSDGGGRYVTRYKKMCALESCSLPARICDPAVGSIFCSDDHAQAWWEQLIATLPRSKAANTNLDFITQQEFMGLLESRGGDQPSEQSHWKLGETPFGVPPDFWTTVDPTQILTPEELSILSTSASDRHALGEEIVLGKHMLQLLDMATKRRDLAAARTSTKDLCGYDARLDSVGPPVQFRAFLQSPHGEAIFAAGKLGPPPPGYEPLLDTAGPADDAWTAGMCTRKKCKPHAGWAAVLGKNVRHRIKELAAQAGEMVRMEERVRGSAAERFQRMRLENNTVEVFDSEDEGWGG